MNRSNNKTTWSSMTAIAVLVMVLLVISSCKDDEGHSSTIVNEPEVIETEAKKEVKDKVNVEGYYEKTAHDGAWFMRLKANGDTCSGRLIQFDGMLPPEDMLVANDGLDEIAKDMEVTYLVVNDDGKSFASNLGTGVLKDGTIIFDDVKDYDDKLVLTKRNITK